VLRINGAPSQQIKTWKRSTNAEWPILRAFLA
jgi:hypothetical protein